MGNSSSLPSPELIPHAYSPSVQDVLEVRDILLARALPVELVDPIIDAAEYWPHQSVDTSRYPPRMMSSLMTWGSYPPQPRAENKFIIRTLPLGALPEHIDGDTYLGLVDSFVSYPLPLIAYPNPSASAMAATEELKRTWAETTMVRGQRPCRKIVFTIHSHDQGLQRGRRPPPGAGTFGHTFTWFDPGIERIEACDETLPLRFPRFPITAEIGDYENPAPITNCILRPMVLNPGASGTYAEGPQASHIVRNRSVFRHTQEHQITWRYDDSIYPGDFLAIRQLHNTGRGAWTGGGDFVRRLQVGETITVWSKARHKGWENHLKYCKIDVYWAV